MTMKIKHVENMLRVYKKEIAPKIELYLMSLGLLFFLLIVKSIDIPICFDQDAQFVGFAYLFKHNISTIICVLFLLVSYICRRRFEHSLKGAVDGDCTINRIKNGNYEYLTFLTTYIIPLICFDLNNIRDAIMLIILLILLGCLFIKTNLYYLNPTLALMGLNIYVADITYKNKSINDVVILSNCNLKKDDRFYKHDIEPLEIVYCPEVLNE